MATMAYAKMNKRFRGGSAAEGFGCAENKSMTSVMVSVSALSIMSIIAAIISAIIDVRIILAILGIIIISLISGYVIPLKQ